MTTVHCGATRTPAPAKYLEKRTDSYVDRA
jgi:hypothetical protein